MRPLYHLTWQRGGGLKTSWQQERLCWTWKRCVQTFWILVHPSSKCSDAVLVCLLVSLSYTHSTVITVAFQDPFTSGNRRCKGGNTPWVCRGVLHAYSCSFSSCVYFLTSCTDIEADTLYYIPVIFVWTIQTLFGHSCFSPFTLCILDVLQIILLLLKCTSHLFRHTLYFDYIWFYFYFF